MPMRFSFRRKSRTAKLKRRWRGRNETALRYPFRLCPPVLSSASTTNFHAINYQNVVVMFRDIFLRTTRRLAGIFLFPIAASLGAATLPGEQFWIAESSLPPPLAAASAAPAGLAAVCAWQLDSS